MLMLFCRKAREQFDSLFCDTDDRLEADKCFLL
jgi:hypothetical protein